LDYGEIEVPSDLDVTYIGVLHNMIGGAPDYMREAFEGADVLVQEGPGWDKALLRQLQDIANGSYTALKGSLESLEQQRKDAPGMADWNEFYFRNLYESGVRVVIADYTKDHPRAEDERKLLHGGGALNQEAVRRIFANRDRHILTSMVGKISELRRMVPDIRDRSPLRVLMLFGAGHYAVHDALAAAAEEQGVTSFSSRLLFQESAALVLGSDSPDQEAAARQRATDYQDWIRTPEG